MEGSGKIRLAPCLAIVLIVFTWFPTAVIASSVTLDCTLNSYIEEEWTQYHSYDEIISGILSLNDSDIVRAVDIRETVEGRTIWAIKISDEPNIEDEQENEVLFVSCLE